MRIFSIIFTILAIASIILSASKVDLDNPFQGDSIVALIMIMAALCALALIYIWITSKKIQERINKKE
ncbi:MAG: hypothetical protein EX254_06135 [Flavobacteriaceae bacterium]|nr:hypothetical protein [Bacteroidia bacterium]NNK28677.1 hypothetical protein [Flavobacteriaceae bacterium]NNL60650.1 hypothetical protein [Flavobacteriaceae bacterium]RZV64338.1 MAG: hypothetical protein EX254_06135 [Flavobacteriaceae bacterium]